MRDALPDIALIIGGILALGLALWYIDIMNGIADSVWRKFSGKDKSEG